MKWLETERERKSRRKKKADHHCLTMREARRFSAEEAN